MSKFNWPVVLVLVALGAGVYFSPHWAVHRMLAAARDHDADRFSTYVDYPALRAHLKADIRGRADRPARSPWAGLRAAVASVFVTPMVDALVTPEGLASMMVRGDAHGQPRGADDAEAAQDHPPETDMKMGYIGLNRFEVKVRKHFDRDEGFGDEPPPPPVVFILSRDGLLSWRLSGIRLPV
jgi:hypothetical protein